MCTTALCWTQQHRPFKGNERAVALDTFEAVSRAILMRSDSFFHRWIEHATLVWGVSCVNDDGRAQMSPVRIPPKIDAPSPQRRGATRGLFKCITMFFHSPIRVDSGSAVVFMHLLLVIANHALPGTVQTCCILLLATPLTTVVCPASESLPHHLMVFTVTQVRRRYGRSGLQIGAGLRVSMPAQP